ncbi:MAG: hypothetical protein GPJ52_13490 [Candidatus Heimdallarchaeota archaeon]|nr:hypothetical protein [Candidatus Heimdallarchaeota archaeon]
MATSEIKYCQKCGSQNPVDKKFCGECGFSFEGKVETKPTRSTEEKTGLATGIISFVLSLFGLSCFPVLGSIAAVILGFMTSDRKTNNFARAGIIIGFIGISIGIFGIFLLIWWRIA